MPGTHSFQNTPALRKYPHGTRMSAGKKDRQDCWARICPRAVRACAGTSFVDVDAVVVLPLYLGGLQPPRSSKRLAQGRECGPNSIALVVRFINTTCQCFFRAGSRADEQHIYDLSSLDDQLVLGIKGTLSVVELKVLRQRMQAGQESKARRAASYSNGLAVPPARRKSQDVARIRAIHQALVNLGFCLVSDPYLCNHSAK